MSVTLRKKPISKGRYSLYLDYYLKGQREYEFLKLYTFKKPKDEPEKAHNKEMIRLAESLRAKREQQIFAEEHSLEPAFKKKVNFMEYYQKFVSQYNKKNFRVVEGSLRYFKNFIGKDYVKPSEVTEQLCIDFRDFLGQHLNGETPANYFTKFKMVLKQATREKIFLSNPALDVTNKGTPDDVRKDVLSMDEIQLLFAAPCSNAEVKRAFLFACLTGLRWCDVKDLQWQHVQGDTLVKAQNKTDRKVMININSSARSLLGKPQKPTQYIFQLPTHTAALKALRGWTERAGINKHVTFHVARHSFATNLIIFGADVKTASSLLGHTSLDHTQKYVRVVESLKQQAVNRLPELKIEL